MNLRIPILFAVPLLLTSCLGVYPFFEVDEHVPQPPKRPRIGALSFKSTPGEMYEPAVAKNFPTAKSIDWALGGTEETFIFFQGDIVIEQILRDNADGHMKIRARLRSTIDQAIAAEYLIIFYDPFGRPLLSEKMKGTGIVLEPYGSVTAWNGCLLPEAETFILFVRPAQVLQE